MTSGEEPAGTAGLARSYVVVPLIAATAAVGLALLDPFRVEAGIVRTLGIFPLVGGIGLVLWTTLTVRTAGESLSPLSKPAALVTDGPFSYTRNPMYLGVVLTATGVAVLGGSPVVGCYAGVLWLTYHGVVVAIEEPKLREVFGPEYVRYAEQVPRWLPRP